MPIFIGSNVIRVVAHDAYGNNSTVATLTVTNSSGGTAPVITNGTASDLAPGGTAIMGYASSLTGTPTSYTNFAKSPPETPAVINGGTSTYAYADTYGAQATDAYVGITWGTATTQAISSINLTMYLFVDGGWFGPKNVNANGTGSTGGNIVATSLTIPTLQVTTDGTTWSTVSETDNYLSQLTGAPANGSAGPVVTFNLTTPQTGIKGVRLIGTGGGTAANFNTGLYPGFIGVSQLKTNTSGLPAGTVGSAYHFTYTATGTPTITFSKTAGSWPTGLSLASSGALSGTPSVAGTFTGTVTAANSAGSASQNFSIVTH